MNAQVRLDKIIAAVLKKAADARMDAGYSGSRGDNGASDMEATVKFYRHGQKNEISPEWKDIADKIDAAHDPEYATYLRLKGKFDPK